MSSEDFTDEELAELKQAYEILDVNNNGSISIEELRKFMESLGIKPSESELYDMIDVVDIDGNQTIDYQEFLKFMKNKKSILCEMEIEIRESFRVFDKNDNGYISKEDFKQILTTIGDTLRDEEVEIFLKEMGADENDQISCDQLVSLFFGKDS